MTADKQLPAKPLKHLDWQMPVHVYLLSSVAKKTLASHPNRR
jgi:hypothetical protein